MPSSTTDAQQCRGLLPAVFQQAGARGSAPKGIPGGHQTLPASPRGRLTAQMRLILITTAPTPVLTARPCCSYYSMQSAAMWSSQGTSTSHMTFAITKSSIKLSACAGSCRGQRLWSLSDPLIVLQLPTNQCQSTAADGLLAADRYCTCRGSTTGRMAWWFQSSKMPRTGPSTSWCATAGMSGRASMTAYPCTSHSSWVRDVHLA